MKKFYNTPFVKIVDFHPVKVICFSPSQGNAGEFIVEDDWNQDSNYSN